MIDPLIFSVRFLLYFINVETVSARLHGTIAAKLKAIVDLGMILFLFQMVIRVRWLSFHLMKKCYQSSRASFS